LARVAFGVLRLPLLVVLLYAARHPILSAIERKFDIIGVTLLAIDVMSTPVVRSLVLLVAFATLVSLAWATRSLPSIRAYTTSLGIACALVLLLLAADLGRKSFLALGMGLLATNWVPDALLARCSISARTQRTFLRVGAGVSELLFAHRFLHWLRGGSEREGATNGLPALVPGALLVSVVLAVGVRGPWLAGAERSLRSGPEVSIITEGDFNGLGLDASGRYLYASGHGFPRLLRFDLDDLAAPPRQSEAETGGAQGLAYDATAHELLVFNAATKDLLVFEAPSLRLSRRVAVPDISPGDPWVAAAPGTNAVAIASEADEQVGVPFVLLDRTTGVVLDRRKEEAGNLLAHPSAPRLYLSFFRRDKGVLAYDVESRRIVARGPTDARIDRLEFDPRRNQVLLASPVEGRILRFDADTLAAVGSLDAVFGVRVMAIDRERDLIFVGSLATGALAAFDLERGKLKQQWYVGPWLRSIVLAPAREHAYVSSNGFLYAIDYSGAT
jgi:hypothetical protein